MHIYRKKSVIFLMGYLIIFLLVLLICLSNLNSKKSLFDIGMDPTLQNWIIILFSISAMVKVVVEIAKIENHAQYDKKLKKMGSNLL